MSAALEFRHQAYTASLPISPHEQLPAASCPPVGSVEFRERLSRVGDLFRAANVGCIYLVHGTHAGLDALGVWAELARWYPPARQSLGRLTKQAIDTIAQDRGNYTQAYADTLAAGINRPHCTEVDVR